MIIARVRDQVVLRRLRWIAVEVGPERRAVVNRKLSVQMQGWVFKNFKTEGKLRLPGGWAKHALSTVIGRARKIRGKEKRAYVRKLYRRGFGREGVMAMTKIGFGKGLLGRFPILQDTGSLRASFLPFHDANEAGVGAVQYVNFRGGGKRPPADLARIHEEGGGHVPARPMLPSKPQALDMALRVYRHERDRIAKGK